MSRAKKEYTIRKRVLNAELSALSTQYAEKVSLSDLAREINISPKKICNYLDKPITLSMAQRFIDFFSSVGVDVTLEYLCGQTPFKNIATFENSTINQTRIKQLEFLRSLGFNYQLGAFIDLYWEQYENMTRKERFRLEYLIEYDFQENLFDETYIKTGGGFPVQQEKIDFSNYKKGLDNYSIEFKKTSVEIFYCFRIIDHSKIIDEKIPSENVFLYPEQFDSWLSEIQKYIVSDMNKKGYLA